MKQPHHLPRLSAAAYQGTAWVHWTMTMRDRARGWLDAGMHSQVRELLLHTMSRYFLHCPGYCLMPDHAHFLWMGVGEVSDQRRAARFFRRHWRIALAARGVCLQPQAYDHILRESEQHPDAFEDTVIYLFRNPERAGLVGDSAEWAYRGSILPGYPDLPQEGLGAFWPTFWKIHNRERTRHQGDREE